MDANGADGDWPQGVRLVRPGIRSRLTSSGHQPTTLRLSFRFYAGEGKGRSAPAKVAPVQRRQANSRFSSDAGL
jgi:hypothetical protein